ncbi:ABC transporter permease [Allorhodopirellula heiligendammensis]|uniref:ABC-2 family transporter protein n=1 Tax=Allorhodopirellula heiligendammensis TaxID=2714739 RepID=A0A5C6BXH0_9BACT|nr:ABC transporter permease subunit [Allorhodopirellula heiligendammensis]TWU15986.1 ABC-2 family transporter protein [Allorhodopirellula heiligendammensis]
MPLRAIFTYKLQGLWKSWLIRSWLIATVLVTFLIVTTNWAVTPTAPMIAMLLFPYLVFPWFLVALLLGLNPVTGSRLEALSDGILSRPVTRLEYLLASWSARVTAALAVLFVGIVPAILIVSLADRPASTDDPVTSYGVVASLAVVAMVITFLVSIGYFAGTAFRSSMFAAAALIFIWMPVNLILHTFSLEEFSPISLNQSLPTLLRTPWHDHDANAEVKLTGGEDMQAAADFLSVLIGSRPAVTKRDPAFYKRGDYKDFSLGRVIMGYGLPTLTALACTTILFYRRDL